MALQMLLQERETTLQNLNDRFKTTQQTYLQQKQELEYSVHKQQKLIEQVAILVFTKIHPMNTIA